MTVTSVSVSGFKKALSEFLNRAAYGRERIIIASRGKPKAAIIGIDDLRLLEEFEEMKDAIAAHEALAAYRAGETTPYEDFRTELVAEGLLDE
jgi:prevent-host-death family protein